MNILAIGDVVGSIGCEFLRSKLSTIKRENAIDLVIANGENSADGNGITPFSAKFLFDSGVDVITTGNHAFKRREIYSFFENNPRLIRPSNFPANSTPGKGFCTVNVKNSQVYIINLMGTVYIDNLLCPFRTIDKLLEKTTNLITLVDFHAEATSEKKALGFYLDGRISALFGTHTHVPTADETILPKGTGYVTDLGMTGVIHSCLGVKPEIVIRKFFTKMPMRFINAEGACELDSVIFSIDEKSGKVNSVKRLLTI
ncbi:MAG: TIGR00282 family metallophosphoesterase [Oscillospiraceae bacterium]|jgi:metallophosphoesterase (TIGR00282 family)|nr:TIGR00282 family metallophosphoesterase [Oscillospiraceae bacterium]